jgi:squalene-hopene/tetraprenyl-beta-curcumene cyclase
MNLGQQATAAKTIWFILSHLSLCLSVAFTLLAVPEGATAGEPPPGKPSARPWASRPDERRAETLSLVNSAAFLDRVTVAWIEKHRCASCHTGFPYLMARQSIGDPKAPARLQVRRFLEDRVAEWDRGGKGTGYLQGFGPVRKTEGVTEIVAIAATLAIDDAQTSGTLHPRTRQALDRMWEMQRSDGSWAWNKTALAPLEYDDYYGTVYAALGLGQAPGGYAGSKAAKEGVARLTGYLRKNPPPNPHHKTWLLWASLKLDGLMTPAEREQTIKDLLALQRHDGGWNLPSLGDWKRRDGKPNDKQAPSDGYATGLVLYVLRQAGVPMEQDAIRRGVDWLKVNQRASGRWFTRSLNQDAGHVITNAGTAYAVMALKACDPGSSVGADDPRRIDPLAGTWVVVSTTNGGQNDPQLKDHTATFADGKLLFKSKDGKEHAATYTLDASKEPATIDLVPADGPHKGKTLKAIFVVEKSELKLCVGKEGEDRPTAFSSKAGEQTVLLTLKKSGAGKQQDDLPPAQVLDHGGFFRPASLGGRDLILLSLAFSPDGKTLASAGGGQLEGRDGGAKGEVKLWDVLTGKELRTIAVENGIVFDAKFTPDGKQLATASGSGSAVPVVPGEIRLWNPATGELVRKLQSHHRGVYGVAFSSDGKWLASGGLAAIVEGKRVDGELTVWDLQTGKELWTRGGHKGAVGSLAFSADGKTLASGGGRFDGKVKLWDVASGNDLGTLGVEAEIIYSVAFAPKAGLVVCSNTLPDKGEGPGKWQVSLWDTIEKKQIKVLHITERWPYRMTLSHKGDLIACTCGNAVKVYEVAKQIEVRNLPSKFRMRPVAFSPDDGLLAAGNDDGTVNLWRVAGLRK